MSERVRVQSSNLDWVEYDSETEQLTIGFKDASVYRYDHVPAAIYDGLLRAASHGGYFSSHIKTVYHFAKVR
ncbi:KTSC domain-containing protein [Candidatus Cryosericum septentrionale]|jgi:hypothetical protein|uniref:KTSC domain-containing protein n=1 Tax=Candidatus Cryosericum septentrionale TaxID=2290913 RepID=A0A398DM04_9BACT|nr:KTSC domain-containing protein [Candidatus Cryosericum septentrionale]RIE16716.1 KTSC domain-containing protein [Candidatus Cryosericum septentrionale]